MEHILAIVPDIRPQTLPSAGNGLQRREKLLLDVRAERLRGPDAERLLDDVREHVQVDVVREVVRVDRRRRERVRGRDVHAPARERAHERGDERRVSRARRGRREGHGQVSGKVQYSVVRM